jgi:hypothetical protein
MKSILPLLLLASAAPGAGEKSYVNFIRQQQQGSGVVWDMPVVPAGEAPSALLMEKGATLLQLWTVEQDEPNDYLLDQKLVGSYLPAATVKVTTLDPYKPLARTRVDQPFTVEIHVSGLLGGDGLPKSATSVLLERHIAGFPEGATRLDAAKVLSEAPNASAYIDMNGPTILKFQASSLTWTDPTKASGEEHFVIHALSDGTLSQTRLAAGFVQVWPIASGEIKGISAGETLGLEAPEIEIALSDLYPRSDTYLKLFDGRQITGVEGRTLVALPVDGESAQSLAMTVDDLDAAISKDGTYTLALMSDTIFGRELLCDPVTFSVDRSLNASALLKTREDEAH